MSIYLHPYAATVWAISTSLMYVLAWIVWFRPGQRRHDLFAIYCTYSALVSTSLIICSALNDGVTYTLIYGATFGSKSLIGLIAACQCAWRVIRKHIGMVGGTWRIARDFIPYAMAAILILCRFRPTVSTLWSSTELALLIVSSGCMWVISFASDAWNVQWRTREYGIASGFLWLTSLRVVIVALRIAIPSSETARLYGVDVCITLVAVLIWIKFFFKKEPNVKHLSLQQLNEVNELILNFQKTSREKHALTRRT